MICKLFAQEILKLVLKERWFWKLVVIYLILFVVPITVAWVIISMPPIIMWISFAVIIVAWLAFRGHRGKVAKDKILEEES
ncbi:MAG: hypothetical protein DRG83_04810 [Deltaproteobacteria bacterium]|nr:MAG: hypothetical protein DRG83_04810 [Deltaproteobacteria bacterium]